MLGDKTPLCTIFPNEEQLYVYIDGGWWRLMFCLVRVKMWFGFACLVKGKQASISRGTCCRSEA